MEIEFVLNTTPLFCQNIFFLFNTQTEAAGLKQKCQPMFTDRILRNSVVVQRLPDAVGSSGKCSYGVPG